MNATTFTTTGDDYTLVLDAKFDLAQAGRNSSDIHVMAFERGYRRAAQELATLLGIEITVIDGSYDGPQMQQQSSNGDEGELWQEIHNRTKAARIKIEIFRDNVWAGDGTLQSDNTIADCAAYLGDDVYSEIESQIDDDSSELEMNGVSYHWDLTVV